MKRLSTRAKPLTKRMRQVLALRIEQPSLTNAAIGKLLGITGQRIGVILASERLQAALVPATKRRLANSVPNAGQKMLDLMEQNVNLEVSRKVAERILDSNRVLEPETHIIKHELELLSTDDLVSRVRESMKVLPVSPATDVIDGELVDNEP